MGPLSVVMPLIKPDSLYMLYYVVASEFPQRPVTDGVVGTDTVVTYVWEPWLQLGLLMVGLLLML